MLIIIDQKMPAEAKKILASYGDLLELKTEGITYPAISGHPDIFFCHAVDNLIVAPNLPGNYFEQLNAYDVKYVIGEFPVGPEYPASARYNAVATGNYLIHNFRHTDFMITRILQDLTPIHVDQGYCRCNLLPLKDDHFITSDAGIFKALKGLQPRGWSPEGRYLLVSPQDILLEGFPNGFFGGCCGVWEDKVFVNGTLAHFVDGKKVRDYLGNLGYEIVELNPGQLEDCGSILCL